MTMMAHRAVHVLLRALGGIRRRPWLHLLSLLTLSAAFLSFVATLNAAMNLDSLLARWVGSAELTAYLAEGARAEDQERLAAAIARLDGVARVEVVSASEARASFIEQLGDFKETVSNLPVSTFPASVDIHLDGPTARSAERRRALAARLEKVETVAEVEIYDDWFERLTALSLVGRLAAWGLGLIAFAVAILVVAAVVRAGVNARSREIEVLDLIGATRRYVQFPFLLQGALETTMSMALAIVGMGFLTRTAEEMTGEIMPLFGVIELVRLGPVAVAMLLGGALLVGLTGARLSLRGLSSA
jgi:cell division transport system permease protein